MRSRFGIRLAVIACLALASCQTTPKPKPGEIVVEGFFPATYVAGIRMEKGSYANLFAAESYAVWVDPAVTALRRDEAVKAGEKIEANFDTQLTRVSDNYIVFECHIASAFGDTSIAYDAVAFRNVSVYLLTPDGRRIEPVQVVVGTPAKEKQQGALRRYERVNQVLFQKQNLWSKQPAVHENAPSARLVLEGYDCTFSFEWPSAFPPPGPWIPNQDEYIKAVKTGFKETYKGIVELGHTLQ